MAKWSHETGIGDWNLSLKSHKEVDIVYLDFAKAFDTVVHSKLVAKLECYNVNAALITWIKCFLSNRLQFVKIGNSCSSTCSVISGVPQGSVLGPVLFIVYINDISDCVLRGSKMKLYADDAKVYTVIDDLNSQAILQQSLDSVLAWSRHWQLALSESKCAVLHLSVGVNHSGLREYFISDYRLPVIDCFTDLGVTFNSKFNFSSHIDKISHRASLRAKLILKCFSTRNVDILKCAFCTFVRP